MKVDLNDQYLFFSVHFVEEKTFCSGLEICLQMSTKMSQNAPKVVRSIKTFVGEHACLIALVIVIPLSFFPLAVFISK